VQVVLQARPIVPADGLGSSQVQPVIPSSSCRPLNKLKRLFLGILFKFFSSTIELSKNGPISPNKEFDFSRESKYFNFFDVRLVLLECKPSLSFAVPLLLLLFAVMTSLAAVPIPDDKAAAASPAAAPILATAPMADDAMQSAVNFSQSLLSTDRNVCVVSWLLLPVGYRKALKTDVRVQK
jgi:hypothetical protein